MPTMMAYHYCKFFVTKIIAATSIAICSNPHFLSTPDNASHTPHNTHHQCTHSIHNFVTLSFCRHRRPFLTHFCSNKIYPLISPLTLSLIAGVSSFITIIASLSSCDNLCHFNEFPITMLLLSWAPWLGLVSALSQETCWYFSNRTFLSFVM